MITKLQDMFNKFKSIFITKIKVPIMETEKAVVENISPKSKGVEFSQIVVLGSLIFAFIWINWFFVLISLGMETGVMASVVISILQNIVYVVLSYFGYQGWLKNSRNKYGIANDGVPYAIKEKYDTDFDAGNMNGEDCSSNATEEDKIDPEDIIN